MREWKRKMKIAIIDDELHWRESAEGFLRQYYSDINVEIDIFECGEKYIKNRKLYDISLVDIEMSGIDGFETIDKARLYNPDGIFIILTTHTEMSRKGYLVNAFRYIDKLNLDEELNEAMKAAEPLLGRNEKITVNVIGDGPRKIILKNILYIETEKHYIVIHTKKGEIRCSDQISDIAEKLDSTWFYRCHNTYIVNLDEISRINQTFLHMTDGNVIEVSARKESGFKKAYLNRQYKCGNA